MRTQLKRSIDVAIERRSRLVMGVVRSVGRGDADMVPAGFCTVQIPGVAAGGNRAVVSAMLPMWSSGITVDVQEGDYVLVLLGSTAGDLATVVWRFPAPPEDRPEEPPAELVGRDAPSFRSSAGKVEGVP